MIVLVATLDERKNGLGETNLISSQLKKDKEAIIGIPLKSLEATRMVKCLVAVPLLVAGEQSTTEEWTI